MYLWIKALHVIAVISWMAGLLYLPRLFVYHCAAPVGSPQSETFKVMERRLLRAIMNPAMIVAWACGLAMITLDPALLKGAGWLHAKLALVVLMTVAHMTMARWRREFAEDRNTRPQRFYRIANEVPTLLMIGIVILVIVRPF
ncbi:protoporphyrinogen oxidase HemJ [Nitrospirillum sp. BR 11752]|uniref:protoporphyrinogen oxidase HemJ n=1 Tax=Nitrospirillum sp. BR 11752 TaxID=3104293 RepID=UPI002EA0DB19|nr:protoporphyrinogen oxidase HemJ [Nitrospirillum sp. BR 11752]